MITTQIKGGKELATRFQHGADRAFAIVEDAVRVEALNLVRVVKLKLTDDVLHVQTGRLRRSITANFEGAGTGTFRALVGTNVQYARVHELGFNGTVKVPAHTVKAHQRTQTMAFGKLLKAPMTVTVRDHVVKESSREMNMPARPFLRPALEENKARILGSIRQALGRIIRENG